MVGIDGSAKVFRRSLIIYQCRWRKVVTVQENRLWKAELQKFANDFGLNVYVLPIFRQVLSKWNKIEHRMFSYISLNWRGRPLTSLEVIVNLIANTTTKSRLKIQAEISDKMYQTGEKISDETLGNLNIMWAYFSS